MELVTSAGERLTLSAAQEADTNVLHSLRQREKKIQMYKHLWAQRAQIQSIVARHLGLRNNAQCAIRSPAEWNAGRFNMCVHVQVTDNRHKVSRKIFRCAMPHTIGNHNAPAAIDERIRSEVANYAWIEKNCPDIPTPKLIGFGLFNGEQFTHERHLPWYRRLAFQIFRFMRSIFSRQHLSAYAARNLSSQLDTGYILMDYIDKDTGTMLATLWDEGKGDQEKKERLYRGVSQIMLSLARTPHPRIGSLRFNDDGSISLASRPLICAISVLENEGAPRLEGPYTSTGPFLQALQEFRANVFTNQPNAVHDKEDCRQQMAYMVLLRSIVPQIFNLQYSGPFFLQHEDLHTGNIFVDADWNITGIIDLEFVCSLPPDMLQLPHRLCIGHLDHVSRHLTQFTETHEIFQRIFATVEREQNVAGTPLADAIHRALPSGRCWLYYCLTSINAMPLLFDENVYPMFGLRMRVKEEEAFAQGLSHFWCLNSEEFVRQKMADKAQYDADLQSHYAKTKPSTGRIVFSLNSEAPRSPSAADSWSGSSTIPGMVLPGL
ncbi:unnamed protein product [Zymoseptoria tritici ST99CH_1A5]|uniref:Aminoglycoside phosphotransferase domain-containing protein n=1 Tax=Zymoseptoria tritici ST99CH_1A5 TaxID=1276529 RepID=A0A1Y6LD66_ZYMTR|nr:unnamed protein product [Zymoseptoria tritici ST99CH_1A5]